MVSNVAQYYLKDEVFFCTDQDRLFFLDLEHDKYLSLSKEQSALFKSLVADLSLPIGADAKPTRAPSTDLFNSLSKSLAERGILTTIRSSGRKVEETVWPIASKNLIESDTKEISDITMSSISKFIYASFIASSRLRWQTLDQIVRSHRTRENKRRMIDKSLKKEDVRKIVLIFRSLRPIYPRNYLCLYDSLALLEFLSFYRIYPRWVFGVIADPFHAHCWVEDDGLVYNDVTDRVRRYKPIMVV